jgi:DNA-binding IclR family transcriptional regulator
MDDSDEMPAHDRVDTPPRSVGRVLQVLERLACSAQGETLSALSALMETPKTSLLNVLRGMQSDGYIKLENGFYRLGHQSYSLALAIVATGSSTDFQALARPFVERFVEEYGETTMLAVLNPEKNAAIYIEKIEAATSIRFAASVGSARPLYASAVGRVLLAFQPAEIIDSYLSSANLAALTLHTVTKKKDIRNKLKEIVVEGVAVSRGEVDTEVFGLAAPIFGAEGKVIAAISIGAPVARGEIKGKLLADALKKTAAAISRAIGYRERDATPRPRRRRMSE